MTEHESIAVVGMAGRFPRSPDISAFWENLVDGVECMTDLSPEDVRARGEVAERMAHPSYVFRRPLIPDMEMFDAPFFGIAPRDAELRDPQHRIFLEVCYSTLEHAGYSSAGYEGAIGLYAGINYSLYEDLHLRKKAGLVETVGELAIETGNHPDYVTTFTSYKLGLRGPSMTIATACSSALVSVHQACQALRNGECDMALAGGVEVEWPYGLGFVHHAGGIYSSDGYCRPFDARGDGTVFGSGAGAVLLKREADAIADGDTIYALVRGSAVNNDGENKVGFSAPSVSGQAICVAEALAAARVAPASISYVEAHGTATRLGDPIEVTALTKAYLAAGEPLPAGSCGIGSVKSNLGHLGPASGIAGLIKTVLALHHERIPPSINFTEPNPGLHIEETPFRVVDTVQDWPRVPGTPRRAGVSSFGIGGTNAHVVLEEAAVPEVTTSASAPELILVSARTTRAIERLRDDLAQHLEWNAVELADVGRTLRGGRRRFEVRDAVVAADPQGAREKLAEPYTPVAEPLGEVVLAFPGQASQFPGMAAELARRSNRFRKAFEASLSAFSDLLGMDFAALWSAGEKDQLAETIVAQPLLYSVEYALACSLRAVGVPVSAVFGHSLGELVGAVVAGVLSPEDGIRVVAERARLMQAMPPGAMAAVAAAEEVVVPHLPDGVCVAAVNAPGETVISGPREKVRSALDILAGLGVEATALRTSHAFHSHSMAPAEEELRAVLAEVRLSQPETALVSCFARNVTSERLVDPAFWAGQLVRPVRFHAAATELFARFPRAHVLETGPGHTLSKLLGIQPAVRAGSARPIPLLGRRRDGAEYGGYLDALGQLWKAGAELDLRQLDAPGSRRIALPGYPFERERHFVDRPPPAPAQAEEQPEHSAGEPEPSGDERHRLWSVTWARAGTVPAAAASSDRQSALVVLPPQPDAARGILAMVQRGGLKPVRVRSSKSDAAADLVLDVGDRTAVFRTIRNLVKRGSLPRTIVYAACYGPADATQDPAAGVKGLLWLIQAVQRFRGEVPLGEIELVVITSNAADVSGGESLTPARAMLAGLLRTLQLEDGTVRCFLLDVGGRTRSDVAGRALRARNHAVAAVRGTDLWLPAIRPLERPDHPDHVLRRRGVYLITGGMGALGRFAARTLADTGLEPHLVLLGRTGAAFDGDGSPEGAEFVADLEASGATVDVIAADVADKTVMTEVLDGIRRNAGPVNGVVHAAGVAGDGLLELRSEQQLDGVLRAKVAGGTVLHDLFADQGALDFVVHYSSRAALTGLVGSGDYAAANGYLDALSGSSTGEHRVVSVNWPGWGEAGMAVRPGGVEDGAKDGEATDLSFDGTEWFLDEHRIDGRPVLPGTGYLDLILTEARRRGLVPVDRPVEVSDLVFATPLVVSGKTSVRVEFRAVGPRFLVTVSSKPGTARTWQLHAEAVLAPSEDEPEAVVPTAVRVPEGEGSSLPTSPGAGLVSFGPRWDNLRTAKRRGGQLIAELSLAETYSADLRDHQAHPALLDVATSLMQRDAAVARLPFLYRKVVFFRPLPAESIVVSKAGLQRNGMLVSDVSVYTTDGQEVVRATGFTMRDVDRRSFSVEPVPPAAPEPVADEEGDRLLTPDEGGALLLRVIESAVSGSVAVLRHGDVLPGYLVLGGRDERTVWPVTSVQPAPEPAVSRVPEPAPAEETPAPAEPATVLSRLRTLWEQLLGVTGIGAEDDFYQIGGSSLSAVQLVSLIRKTFDVQLSVGVIFEKPSLEALASEVERLRTA
jgi:phthiocerol/phenolphthiocerol synthesis type-I polyketide synthase E